MYICTGCKTISERMDSLEHSAMCNGGTYMDFSVYLGSQDDRIIELEQQIASVRADLSLAAAILRKYTKE